MSTRGSDRNPPVRYKDMPAEEIVSEIFGALCEAERNAPNPAAGDLIFRAQALLREQAREKGWLIAFKAHYA